MTDDSRSRSRDGVTASRYGRRRFIAVGSGVGAALLAGCTSEDSGGDGTPTDDGGDGSGGGGTANFRLLVSDAPADIDDFDRLDVTFSQARVFEGGDGGDGGEGTETEGTDDEGTENGTETQNGTGNETSGEMTETVEEDEQTNETDAEDGTETENRTATGTENGSETENGTETDAEDDGEGDDGGEGFYVLELDSPTVDLTQVVGDKAEPIFDGELEAGSYQKLELHVESTEGVVDGETVEVKVPSNKLQLTKPFEVRAGEELDFVFDINVVKRGNRASYILKPVISQSGVRGEDVEVEEVGEGDGEGGTGSDDGAGSNGSDDEGGDGGGTETGGAGNETGGNETGGAGGNESAA